jgi:hypothetical protein
MKIARCRFCNKCIVYDLVFAADRCMWVRESDGSNYCHTSPDDRHGPRIWDSLCNWWKER